MAAVISGDVTLPLDESRAAELLCKNSRQRNGLSVVMMLCCGCPCILVQLLQLVAAIETFTMRSYVQDSSTDQSQTDTPTFMFPTY